MSAIIEFLESAGRNAAMRYATREQLLQMMGRAEIAPAAVDSLLGARETMFCGTLLVKPPAAAKKPAMRTPTKKH